jgi:hypothetical protein
MQQPVFNALVAVVAVGLGVGRAAAGENLPDRAREALRRAVNFYRTEVAVHGGYVYLYSSDLTKREGEGVAGPETVWIQPPGTPAVGMAYLEAYERTGDADLLDAAKAAADCLIRGQLRSGGWAVSIEFDADARRRWAYRVDPPQPKASNVTTFDDDKTQSAMRFLIRLDQVLKFRDKRLHEAITFALDSAIKAQYPNGAWPQGYSEFPDAAKFPVKRASFPDSWPRSYPGEKYRLRYTFNDNAIADIIDVMLLAARVYGETRYRDSAVRAGDFVLLAQMPAPQPAWAQQYDVDMHPAWARKFEPPAISGSESQGVLQVLLRLYTETGDRKFLNAVPPALEYLRRSQLPDGRLARFYELQTNKPLYLTKQYELTYDDGDVPTHYGFKIGSKVEQLGQQHERLSRMTPEQLAAQRNPQPKRFSLSRSLEADVERTIAELDKRGAWVEDGRLRYHDESDDTRRIIDSRTFIRNIDLLSRYLAAIER